MTPRDYNSLVRLYQQQSELIASFPKARSELIDFHYKDRLDSYLEAIDGFNGRKLFLAADSSHEAASLIRRSLLLSDLIVFSVDSFIGHPALALVPISDELASPILGASAMLDPATGDYTFAPAAVFMTGIGLSMISAAESSEKIQVLGTSWSASGTNGWERTMFARLADEMKDVRGTPCHVAGGLIHIQLPKDETLLDAAAPLMKMGRVVYAPFIIGNVASQPPEQLLVKAGMIGSTLATPTPPTHSLANIEQVLLRLEIPYLENLPLSTIAKVIADEAESIQSFRRQFDRLLEDLTQAKDDLESSKRITKFRRDLLEDELDKVRSALSRVASMNSVIRSGAYIGVTSLTVAATQGLSLPSLITGLSGTAAASLVAWYPLVP
jgi:hypothetical protein